MNKSIQRAIVDEEHLEGSAKLLRDAVKQGTEKVLVLLGCWLEQMTHSVFKFIQERSETTYSRLEHLLIDTPEGWRFFFG